jgi:hypothetical protein
MIRTPEQFFQALAAILQYLKNELAKNPDWEPPEEVLRGLFRIKPFLDELRPIVEARMLGLRSRNEAVGPSATAQCTSGITCQWLPE